MNIYLRIEVLGRELQGRLLLGLAAAERGHHVALLDNPTAFDLAENIRRPLPPGFFHDNSPGQEGGKTLLHEKLARRGFLISGQDEEHGLASDDFRADMGGRFPPRAMANKSAMFAFGHYDAVGIRQDCPEHGDRVIVTGSPRIDFWRSDFAPYFAHLPHPLGPTEPKYVLIVMSSSPFFREGPSMSFSGSGGSPGELERRIAALAESGLEPVLVESYRRVVALKLAVEDLARRHDGVRFVHRPHPHEVLSAWEEVFRDAPPNVSVIRDNAVSPWIRRASCVVFSGSTVGFEAALAGVPVVSFQPDDYDTTPAASRMGHRATTAAGLSKLVGSILDGCEPSLPLERSAAMRATLNERFFALEGRLACDRIVDEWERLATPALEAAVSVVARDLRPEITPRRIARAIRDTSMAALRLEDETRRRRRLADRALLDLKFPRFDIDEIRRIHAGLVAGLGRFSSVRITQLGARTLHLTP